MSGCADNLGQFLSHISWNCSPFDAVVTAHSPRSPTCTFLGA